MLVYFATSQLASNILTLLSGFLVVKSIDPETYGLFAGFQVYLGYILLMHGGILNGIGRELPFLLGKGDLKSGKELADSANLLTLVIGLTASLVFLILSGFQLWQKQFVLSLILLSYAIIAFFHLFNSIFLPFLYRTNKDFNSLAHQRIKQGIVNLLTVLLVWRFGIYGLCIRGVLLSLLIFTLLYKHKPYDLNFKYSLENYRHLLKVGFPIFLVGRITPLWQTVMNNYIVVAGGPLYYGYYAISMIIKGTVNTIPSAFSQVIYPRMSIMFGEGKQIDYILNRSLKPLAFQFILMLAVTITGALILPDIVDYLLPKYSPGIKAAQWAIFIPLVSSLGALNNIFNVVGKQKLYIAALTIGAIIGTAFVFVSIDILGFRLEIFSQGLVVGTLFQQLIAFTMLIKVKQYYT